VPAINFLDSRQRLEFFDKLWGSQEGFVCLSSKIPYMPNAGFNQRFFEWPKRVDQIEEFINKNKDDKNLYFCVNLLSKPERRKEFCLRTNLLWADLDEVDPREFDLAPPIVIQTSEGRFQAIWRMSVEVDPEQAEDYSRRIAYKYGADKSGWDLTQLLRIPTTLNFKYDTPFLVELLVNADTLAPPLLFEALPAPEGVSDSTSITFADVPSDDSLPMPEAVIYKYSVNLRNTDFRSLYSLDMEDRADWSRPLWRLIHICLEAGMSPEETYAVAKTAKCNKYERDKRPATHLWRDILKASNKQEELNILTSQFKPLMMPQLVVDGYEPTKSFVTEYREWAEEATDAVPDFHDLSAFILLSSIVANSVKLETSYGPLYPNLWGMLLGDSTLTRKTTAMRMVMEILNTLNRDMVLGTDGSAEGLLSGLQLRPNRTSIFFRDELSGFFDAINRKDYLAGMPETLTHLYDVPEVYQRVLRKETIRLESPIFIFFGGGVRDKIYEVSTEEYIISGFVPRFLIVSGYADLDRLRRTGPPSESGVTKKAKLVAHCANLYEHYAAEVNTSIGGEKVMLPPRIGVTLTPTAWQTYGIIEDLMVRAASDSAFPHLALPTFERLSRSILKMSMVLAASRQEPNITNQIEVSMADVNDAGWYVQRWGQFSIEMVLNCGKGVNERVFDRITRSIKENPGIMRSALMQHHHLTKKTADDILGTLEERMIITREKRGRGTAYFPA